MREIPPPLDLSRLAAGTAGLQAVLVFSTAVGVVVGMSLLAIVVVFTSLGATAGLAGLVLLAALTGVAVARIMLLAAAAVIIIPIAATIAAYLKLRRAEEFILVDCRAKPPAEGSRVHELLAYAARQAGMTTVPSYGLIENTFNAFAMSSSRTVGLVLIGKPLIAGLEGHETFAIMCHEVGHIAMMDSQRKYLAMAHQEFLVRFLMWRGLQRLALNIFGVIGQIALAAHSREREYWADAVGAHIAGKDNMIAALKRLARSDERPTRLEKRYNALMVRPAGALFSTHPPFHKRIAALEDETYLRRLPLAGGQR